MKDFEGSKMGDYSDTIYKFVNSVMNVKDDLENFQESLSDFISENQILLKNILSGNEVMLSDFLGLCDERVYNMDNKQNDIKYMKRLDFAGLYYIKNITKRKCYVGRADSVYKKVERYFKGHENQEIFNDFNENNKFVVCFIKYEKEAYGSFEEFIADKIEQLQPRLTGYQYFGLKISKIKRNKSAVKGSASDSFVDKPTDKVVNAKEAESHLKIIDEKIFWKKRVKALVFHRKKLSLEYGIESLKGNYVSVLNKLKENGFNNIKIIPLRDIYTDSNYVLDEVDSVTINNNESFVQGDMFLYDADIEVKYHSKKELEFPYTPRAVKKQNCGELLNKLHEIGFTEIKTMPIKDLTVGWLVKNDSIEKIKINHSENFKKDDIFCYDAPIVIYYHTFK